MTQENLRKLSSVHRWRLTDGLPYVVNVVRDLQLGHLLLELLGQLLGGEAHGVDVVGPHAQRVSWRLHHLQRGAQAVVDVHHGQPRVGSQVALKLAAFDCVVENLDGVVWSERGIQALGLHKSWNKPDTAVILCVKKGVDAVPTSENMEIVRLLA